MPDLFAAPTRALDLTSTEEQARRFAENARSKNTRRAYQSDWDDFTRWCQQRGVDALPATVDTVTLYITDRATGAAGSPALAVSTLRRRLTAISQAHKLRHHPSPATTSLEPLHSVWKGIVREKTKKKKKATPVLVEDVRAILEGALPRDASGAMTLQAVRDRALLLIGWQGGLRRSEIAELDVEDALIGVDGIRLTIRRSKTDQEGEGLVKGLPRGAEPLTCSARALTNWLEASGIEDGPIFRGIDRHGNIAQKALTSDGVHRIIKRACKRAGLNPKHYSGHSLRSGFITQAARAGKAERDIMRHTGHKDIKTMRAYIHEGGLFLDNAAEGIGL